MLRRIQYLLDGRLFEWAFSACTLWIAVEVFRYPGSVAAGAFHMILETMLPETLAAYAFGISLCGIAALSTNGYSTIVGPSVRGVCAVGRAYLWGQMAYALILRDLNNPEPSIGTGFWVIFACAELYVAYRAMNDVQRDI